MSVAKELIKEQMRKAYGEYAKNLIECDICRYTFNKEYERSCPICKTKPKF